MVVMSVNGAAHPSTDNDAVGNSPSAGLANFRASHGGPFFELQAQLRLLRENTLRAGTRAVLFVALAWGVPFLLGIPRSFSLDHSHNAYLADPGVWAKFFIGIGAFVLAEQQVERGLRARLAQFVRAPIIAPTAMAQATRELSEALRQRDSRRAELVCLVVAIFAAALSYLNFHTGDVSSWAVEHRQDAIRPHRSRGAVIRFAETISIQNNALSAGSDIERSPGQLNAVLGSVAALARHDHLIIVVSDFEGHGPETRDLLLRMSVANDVIAVLDYDPFLLDLPSQGEMVVSGGALQAELQFGRGNVRDAVDSFARNRGRELLSWQEEMGLPMLPVSAAEEVAPQLRTLLGQLAWR
jgi:hypothetical protein